MSIRKRGLGKNNLEVLLGELSPMIRDQATTSTLNNMKENTRFSNIDEQDNPSSKNQLIQVALSQLQPGRYQPRQIFDSDELTELADSIKQHGLLQPILIKKLDDQNYEIIAGERRFRAAGMAGLTEIPALCQDVSDEAIMAIALIENMQRKNLNPLEEAEGVHTLKKEYMLTDQRIAELLGRSRTAITNALRLLKLTSEVKRCLLNGDIDMGHARCLLSLPDAEQEKILRWVIEKNQTVRQTEEIVRRFHASEINIENIFHAANTSSKKIPDENLVKIEDELKKLFGKKTKLKPKVNGAGQIILAYSSQLQFEELLNKLRVT